jgi:hypothetical protein
MTRLLELLWTRRGYLFRGVIGIWQGYQNYYGREGGIYLEVLLGYDKVIRTNMDVMGYYLEVHNIIVSMTFI